MLSILINAYACSPGMGSEPGMAWNWCVNLAQYCELHIITEGEFRDRIEAVLPTLPHGANMFFYYNPVSDDIRKMCWNQGDWRFYRYYKKWQMATYHLAKQICGKTKIDILHQLNMIGFREPGYLWKLSIEECIPFVWGPIGGLKQFPTQYLKGAGLKMKFFNKLKNFVNVMQIKYGLRVDKALRNADLIISSIPDSYKMIKKYKHLESVIIPETGCYPYYAKNVKVNEGKESLKLLWVGKFDYRKQLGIAIRTMAEVKCFKSINLTICGSGNDKQVMSYMQLAKRLGVEEQITWRGNITNREVLSEMKVSDLFFFTSVSEDTSTVVLEAISCGLPVMCFDACGMSAVISDAIGIKIPLTTPDQSVKDFAKNIIYLYNNRGVLVKLSENCQQRQEVLSWNNKAKQMMDLYEKCVEQYSRR